jgi:hypothetical protein
MLNTFDSVPALMLHTGFDAARAGALVVGPDAWDAFSDDRSSPQSRVGLHYNAPLLGALAGLVHMGVAAGHCQGGRGFVQSEALPYAP